MQPGVRGSPHECCLAAHVQSEAGKQHSDGLAMQSGILETTYRDKGGLEPERLLGDAGGQLKDLMPPLDSYGFHLQTGTIRERRKGNRLDVMSPRLNLSSPFSHLCFSGTLLNIAKSQLLLFGGAGNAYNSSNSFVVFLNFKLVYQKFFLMPKLTLPH